ncbi:secreted LysM effector Blys4-like [Apium graveolens]|uniref:secreted LysM effector Blys4-like n=1 Tax=Apium graveolens TaxID=4045 RepID=UPI003D79A1A6
MAGISDNRSAFLVLTLALLLVFTIVESRPGRFAKASVPTCDSVFGVRSGDTCFGIAQSFALSTAEFSSINPNVNCAALFVGQWLCVVGSA